MSTCRCDCHSSAGVYKLRCSIDNGSSGVPGLPSCSPCSADVVDESLWCVLHSGRKLATVGQLCDHHREALRETLADIAEMYALLPQYRMPGSTPEAETGEHKHTKKADHPALVRLIVLALEDKRNGPVLEPGDVPDVPSVLAEWAENVRDERALSALVDGSVGESVRLLQAHGDWIAAQDWLVDFDADLRMLRRSLAMGIGRTGSKPVGKCPSLDGDGKVCLGPLWPATNGMSVDCGTCKRHFDEKFLRHLGGMMTA